MAKLLKNNAESTLASTASAVATTLTVVDGSVFPSPGSDTFLLTLTQGSGPETSWEVVLCTARTGNDLTVIRAQEGTTAVEWIAGSKVSMRLTAGFFGGSDAALSDSREWTAETVEQAEAEAGTATTRRAWTAQRVRQAITGWWNTISAADLPFDNAASGLAATNAQDAIDELAAEKADKTLTRERLTANRTYYVRTDGSDSNDGLSDTSGGAFLTIQKALQVAASVDLSGFALKVKVGAGTYAENVVLPVLVGGYGTLEGDVSDWDAVVISPASGDAVVVEGAGNFWTVLGVKVESATGSGITVNRLAALNYGQIDFGACALRHVSCNNSALFFAVGDVEISGPAQTHIFCSGASGLCAGRTITIVGSIGFTSSFATSTVNSTVRLNANTFSGSATGVRYRVTAGGVMSVNGAGATYLPGNSDGYNDGTGIYV